MQGDFAHNLLGLRGAGRISDKCPLLVCLSRTCTRDLTVGNFRQDTFYGLHHLYIGRMSVYVIMFNMEWFLPGHSCDKCNGGSEHLAFLAFWLDSIAAHAVDPKEEPEIAPIVLVGTHKDRVSSSADHEMISKMLDKTFSGKRAWSSVERYTNASVPAEGRRPNQDTSESEPTAGDGAAQQAQNGESNESSLHKEIAEEDREAEAVRNELQVPHYVFIGFPIFHPPLLPSALLC